MDVGGACASGGAYEIRQACPKGVGWVIPVSIFGMFFAGVFTFLGVFDEGGPRPTCSRGRRSSSRSAGTSSTTASTRPASTAPSWGWLICGIVFVRWADPAPLPASPRDRPLVALGPDSQRADDYLHPYKPPPIRRSPTPARRAADDLDRALEHPVRPRRGHDPLPRSPTPPPKISSCRHRETPPKPREPTEGRRRRTARHAGRPARARHARRRRVREGQERGPR